ncbi:hypothetical protein J4437_03145 [Candidatus Woesearchaeota archaeon]|nr:hypothetical protein [Candidatus Woesearchaeota archaeon]
MRFSLSKNINKKGVDWTSPQTLAILLLSLLLGLAFLYFVWQLRGKVGL